MSLPVLDPCPFCGGEAVLDGRSDSVRPRCLQCGTQGSPRFFREEDDDAVMAQAELEAALAWNRRQAA